MPQIVDAPDLARETRWADYPRIALGHGIHSVHSIPLVVNHAPVGVLNLYARAPHGFGAEQRQLVTLLAGQATLVLTAALRHYDEVSLSEHLRTALSSRSVIDQAIGIVMAAQRCPPDEAFTTLRTMSQRRNVKLRVVATELVAATSSPDPRLPDSAPPES